jgi:epsilon-lactone hydrolase
MRSREAGIASLVMRAQRLLFLMSFYPTAYQRTMMSAFARLGNEQKGCSYETEADCPVPATWVVPVEAAEDTVMLYIHGGGYVIGSARTHRALISRISSAVGCRALAIDYRLAPEHPFPAGLDDAVAAYRWLLARGYEPGNIVIAGDSAGGGLTLATLLALRDAGEELPAAAVLMSPWTDIENDGASMKYNAGSEPFISAKLGNKWAGMYCAGADPRTPLISPVRADLDGLPPMLLQIGTYDILLDDARSFRAAARAYDAPLEYEEWEGMFHVWHIVAPLVPESRRAIRRIGEFCREKLDATP